MAPDIPVPQEARRSQHTPAPSLQRTPSRSFFSRNKRLWVGAAVCMLPVEVLGCWWLLSLQTSNPSESAADGQAKTTRTEGDGRPGADIAASAGTTSAAPVTALPSAPVIAETTKPVKAVTPGKPAVERAAPTAIDLLAIIDPTRNSVLGNWSKDSGGKLR